jgi:hypothetical protein
VKFKPVPLFAAFLLCAASAFAQGTIRFDWHGDHNLFQASFQVYDYQMAPGGNFEGPDWSSGKYQDALFDRTFTITGPYFNFVPGTCYGTGGDPIHNGFDINRNLMIGVNARNGDYDASASSNVVGEGYLDQSLWEYGYWTWAPIPEPSAFSLFGLGLLAMYMKKAGRVK